MKSYSMLTAFVALFSFIQIAVADDSWVSVFLAAPQYIKATKTTPPADFVGDNVFLHDATIRQTFRLRLGADSYRLNISNIYGESPLTLTGVTVGATAANASGITAGQPNIQSGTIKSVLFGGQASYTIPSGGVVVSDSVDISLGDNQDISVSIYLQDGQQGSGTALSVHHGSQTTSYITPGDKTNVETLPNFGTKPNNHWYFVTAVQAQRSTGSALVCIGDSITDGVGSGTNANNRWVDDLAARVRGNSDTSDIAVINAGIGGNHVVSQPGTATPAVDRIGRDVLSQPGVKYVFILEGINDIGHANNDTNTTNTLYDSMVDAYTSIIQQVHDAGLPIFGATIMPDHNPDYSGYPNKYYTNLREDLRLRLNDWIMNHANYNAVFDYAQAVRNASMPNQMADRYAYTSYLHPNAEGHQALADTWDLGVFAQFANGV